MLSKALSMLFFLCCGPAVPKGYGSESYFVEAGLVCYFEDGPREWYTTDPPPPALCIGKDGRRELVPLDELRRRIGQ